MMKVKSMLTETLMACPADLISIGKISLGTNHPSGPQDQAKAATNRQTRSSTRSATSIWTPPSMNKILLPTLSTVKTETRVQRTLATPVITADMRAASLPKPIDLNKTGA